MFTGIIETIGKVTSIQENSTNIDFRIKSNISDELKIDQSVSHNGVCLTVVSTAPGEHTVTAVAETLAKSSLGQLKVNDEVNLERCVKLGARLDGHIVQGHVDQTGVCTNIEDKDGSWIFTFDYDRTRGNITVEKGSISVNGISLTVFNSSEGRFSVAIIPYTFENTNFKNLHVGDTVNLEFDIIGKYIAKLMPQKN